jgi:hypothetical protein
MVDEPGEIPTLGGIDDILHVNPEEIRGPDAHFLVVNFPEVGHDGPDGLTHVLDDHLVRSDGLHRKQTPVVDARLAELQLLFPELRGTINLLSFEVIF